MKNVWFWIFMVLTIAWMTVIFAFSAKDADTSTVTSYKVGRTIGRLFVPGFEQMPEDEQTAFAARIDKPVRKTAHACEYAVLGVRLAAHVSNGLKSRIRPVVGRI